jgi:hypothetical protein
MVYYPMYPVVYYPTVEEVACYAGIALYLVYLRSIVYALDSISWHCHRQLSTLNRERMWMASNFLLMVVAAVFFCCVLIVSRPRFP